MSSDSIIYTKLSIKHFENAVSRCTHLPIPVCIRAHVVAIFILQNPRFPNHFLNGCYVVLHSSVEPLQARKLLSFLGADSEPLEHGPLSHLCQSTFLRPHLPLRLCTRILGWPSELAPHFPATWSSEGTSVVLSIIPTPWDRLRAFMKCYSAQIFTGSRIVEGSEYFASTYPAKANLVNHETTFACVCKRTNKPVGYIQLTGLVDDMEKLHVLITGLAVEEGFRRRGLGRVMLLYIIANIPAEEIWVEVQEDYHPARRLYLHCGFVVRKKQETLNRRVIISRPPSLMNSDE